MSHQNPTPSEPENGGDKTHTSSRSSPTDSKQQQQPALKHLFAFTTRQHFGPLAAGLVASLFLGALRTSLSILMGKIFAVVADFGSGKLSGPDTLAQVSSWCAILTLTGGAGWLVNFAFTFSWTVFGELQARNIRRMTFYALLKKDMSWFDLQENGIASLLVTTQTQSRELQSASSVALGSLVAEAATSLGNLVVALHGSWKLTLVLLATVPVSLVVLSLLSHRFKSAIRAQKQELARASKYAISAVAAVDLVKIFNASDHETWQYLHAIQRSANRYLVQAGAAACQHAYVKLWVEGMFVLGFYYGAVLVNGGASPGNIVTTFYAALAALQAFQAFVPTYIILAKGMAAGQALDSIISDSADGRKVRRMKGSYRPEECLGRVEINEVSFAYPSNPSKLVLDGSSFVFAAGQLCFVVGRSGSGKSTLGNLLANFYEPLGGDILIDGYALRTLDDEWVRSNVTLIQQTSVLFNDTFLMNVAMGRGDPTLVSRAEVEAACETALLQSTLSGLPQGLDTYLGPGGIDLSGGQKQRLALARAKLRDTPVLILDEVTSGLDILSRSLVMDAIRKWRRGKTTIVITHEVAQIENQDFVYVMDDARVVQKGLRGDIQLQQGSMFATLVASSVVDNWGDEWEYETVSEAETSAAVNFSPPRSITSQGSPPMPTYFWPFHSRESSQYPARQFDLRYQDEADYHKPRMGGSVMQTIFSRTVDSIGKRLSTPRKSENYPVPPNESGARTGKRTSLDRIRDLGDMVRNNRGRSVRRVRQQISGPKDTSTSGLRSRDSTEKDIGEESDDTKRKPQVRATVPLRSIYKTVWSCLTFKERIFLVTGLFASLAVAGSVPAFSVVFANLLAVLYSNGDRVAAGRMWALYLLLIASTGSMAMFLSQYLMQRAAQAWIDALRIQALSRILRQPKAWFDKPEHSAGRVGECMDRNAEEMRNLVGRFAPLLLILVVMVSGTLAWSLVISWQLTLVSLASAPILAAATKAFSVVSQRWDARCDRAVEDIGAVASETFTNVRVVKTLTLENFFSEKQDRLSRAAFELGIKRATWTATLFACWQSALWFTMALIFWYATVLLSGDGEITAQAILQVVNLLVIGLTSASSVLNSIPGISAAQVTASQLLYYANLPTDASHESKGNTKLVNPLPICMDGFSFTYSSQRRPVLRDLSLRFDAGTSTALVGSSGCGKSTLVSVILGLHAPDSSPVGRQALTFASVPASQISVHGLRRQIGYVPQAPFLFPGTLAENICYGLPENSPLRARENLERAARETGIHDFIRSLAAGYDTIVGDGGQALSGGQAQRVCIARALARRPKILVLDEPTSALDAESAEAVSNTICSLMRSAEDSFQYDESFDLFAPRREGQVGLCVIMITHSKEMMRVADRVVVIDRGRAVESGPYHELVATRGKLTELLSGGRWMGGHGDENIEKRPGGVRKDKKENGKHGRATANDLPLRRTGSSDENSPVTPRWAGLRDMHWLDNRGPSTGMSPLASPFGGPSRRKERKGDESV
ncbi:hypothetical protein Hte_011720 [Hypoxylon texense]